MQKRILEGRSTVILAASIIALVCIGLFRISLTYDVYSQTWDESAHIAAGMEWLDRGQYTYERFHPPLARVMSALGPYATGIRGTNEESMWAEGNSILQANGTYERNLSLARLGILPFFVIASLVVAIWSYSYGGAVPALLAVILFTTLPSTLGHAGVAALDMASAAMVATAMFMLHRWINQPTLLTGGLLGLAVGLTILAKFSGLMFLVASGLLISATYVFGMLRHGLPTKPGFPGIATRAGSSSIALLICSLTVWGGYRFSTQSFDARPYQRIDTIFGTEGALRDIAYSLLERVPIPAPDFIYGLWDFFARNESGQLAYLLGDIRTDGWWYFNPVVLFVKTPLPFTILTVVGIFFVLREVMAKREDEGFLTPIAALAGILAIGMLGSVSNGTRQVLPVYPFAAILAGYGAWRLVSLARERHRQLGTGIVALLMAWQVGVSVSAHPDYLPYFNFLAAGQPERIVVDSDLDWGQDLKRLGLRLEDRKIDSVKIKYNGSSRIDFDDFNFPPWEMLHPYQETSGWIAISALHLQLGTKRSPYDQFSWLKRHEPVERVGKSIFLYYVPEEFD